MPDVKTDELFSDSRPSLRSAVVNHGKDVHRKRSAALTASAVSRDVGAEYRVRRARYRAPSSVVQSLWVRTDQVIRREVRAASSSLNLASLQSHNRNPHCKWAKDLCSGLNAWLWMPARRKHVNNIASSTL